MGNTMELVFHDVNAWFSRKVLPWALLDDGGPGKEDLNPYETHPRIFVPPVYAKLPGPYEVQHLPPLSPDGPKNVHPVGNG
jgi:hypothetical protein